MSDYSDIINTERPQSPAHKPMSRLSRAAQFAPFAALTGYDDLIREAARETNEKIELFDEQKQKIGEDMGFLLEHKDIFATFIVFIADEKKDGGSYNEFYGSVRSYDVEKDIVTLDSCVMFCVDDIYGILLD